MQAISFLDVFLLADSVVVLEDFRGFSGDFLPDDTSSGELLDADLFMLVSNSFVGVFFNSFSGAFEDCFVPSEVLLDSLLFSPPESSPNLRRRDSQGVKDRDHQSVKGEQV